MSAAAGDAEPLVGGGAPAPAKSCCTPKCAGIGCGVAICCTCCCYLALLIIAGIAGYKLLASMPMELGHQVYANDGAKVTPPNVSQYEWWPACTGPAGSKATGSGPTSQVTNCGSACCNCKERDAFRDYTSKAKYLEVSFPSRQGEAGQKTVKLVGWWLPADPQWDSGAAVVLQHGLKGTINDFRPALVAYLVRAAGFSVLLPNLRAHGASEAPGHGRLSWGYDYPYDILGAWDYVVKDPDGKLGGPRDSSKVGIMGLSMGGFIAATAFGMEEDIPALWLDGPVSDPADLLPGQIRQMMPIGGAFLATIIRPAWFITEILSGMPLRHHSPAKELPKGPQTKRPVMLAQSRDDAQVPAFMAEHYVKTLEEHPTKYDLTKSMDWGGKCDAGGGRIETHNMLMWLHPQEYRAKLCDFWSDALLQKPCDDSALVPLTYS